MERILKEVEIKALSGILVRLEIDNNMRLFQSQLSIIKS